MEKVEENYKDVCEFMARDQYLESCNRALYVHLKPKTFKSLDGMAMEADLFAEARGSVCNCISKGQGENRGVSQSKFDKTESKPSRKMDIRCKICNKGHYTHKCWKSR